MDFDFLTGPPTTTIQSPPPHPHVAATVADIMSMPAKQQSTMTHASNPQSSPAGHGQQNGSRYYNPSILSAIREDWIHQRMHVRAHEFTEEKQMNIWTGTFNVNGKKPVSVQESPKLLLWLRQQQQQQQQQQQASSSSSSSSSFACPDIVAVGFQEIVDLNAVNVVVNNMSATRSTQWEESILTVLNQHLPKEQHSHSHVKNDHDRKGNDNAYHVVMNRHLVGILLLVFVKRQHAAHVSDVISATAGVGLMGVMVRTDRTTRGCGHPDTSEMYPESPREKTWFVRIGQNERVIKADEIQPGSRICGGNLECPPLGI
jgi:hypothetical protein